MKFISFYLPQYHPFKENDEWWGKGFTEWRNVVKTKPRYRNHYQPKLPGDLGFYDIRLPDVREEQARLANENGIHGFCYYHYWFNGKILMERPFKEVLESGAPDFPFCLCWANENWTRAWDGGVKNILIEQDHSKEDNINHIRYLIKAFKDTRYIKVNEKPLLLIYRVDLIPDIKELIILWRAEVKKAGFEDVHLMAVKNGFVQHGMEEIIDMGFDAVVEFQPNFKYFPNSFIKKLEKKVQNISKYIFEKVGFGSAHDIIFSKDERLNYSDIVDNSISQFNYEAKVYPTVFPTWDNSARRKQSRIIENEDADRYQFWLENMALKVQDKFDPAEQFLFINAWNEWAEGCYLEPDLKLGNRFLKATKKANDRFTNK